MAIWEMTSLLVAPKKVFRSIYYHVRRPIFPAPPSEPPADHTHRRRNVRPPPRAPSLPPNKPPAQKRKTPGTAPTPPSPTCSPSSCSSRASRGASPTRPPWAQSCGSPSSSSSCTSWPCRCSWRPGHSSSWAGCSGRASRGCRGGGDSRGCLRRRGRGSSWSSGIVLM